MLIGVIIENTFIVSFNACDGYFGVILIQTDVIEAVEKLLKNGTDPNERPLNSESPLQIAFAICMFHTILKLYSIIHL